MMEKIETMNPKDVSVRHPYNTTTRSTDDRHHFKALYTEAVLRGGQGATVPLWELCPPCGPPNETVYKVARLHDTCIYSVASHSWCQITPFTQSCIMSSGILAPSQKTDLATPLTTLNCCS